MLSAQQLYQIYLQFPNVVIDSRKVVPDCLFFAIKGERFDGNRFAGQAIDKGARYAIIDNPEYARNEQYLVVENTLKTMQMLANFHRKQFEIPLIAITGSNGKTTTKELVSQVLGSHYRTHFTKGNFNNHIGLPLTLLDMPADTEVAIIEMGANHIGEIRFLCNIAEPTHGLITNIGKAHLEGFGGLEGVKKGKSELYAYLCKNNGLAFINIDEPFLKAQAEKVPHKVYYHKSDAPDPAYQPLETTLVSEKPFLKVAFLSNHHKVEIQSQLLGHYNFNNIQSAVSLGRYFKVPPEKIKSAIENYIPQNNRSQIIQRNSNTFILDAYNANPSSMKLALKHFSEMQAPSKIAILGDMLELGAHSFHEHTSIIEYALKLRFNALVLVGNEFIKSKTSGDSVLCFANTDELILWYNKQHFKNHSFLIKGSRGLGLEQLLFRH